MFIFHSDKEQSNQETNKSLSTASAPFFLCPYNSLIWNILYWVQDYKLLLMLIQQFSQVADGAIFKSCCSWYNRAKEWLLPSSSVHFSVHFEPFLMFRVLDSFKSKFLAQVFSSCIKGEKISSFKGRTIWTIVHLRWASLNWMFVWADRRSI